MEFNIVIFKSNIKFYSWTKGDESLGQASWVTSICWVSTSVAYVIISVESWGSTGWIASIVSSSTINTSSLK
jgi:hypothetical protein